MLGVDQVRLGLQRAGQAHVLQFWSELCEEERDAFLRELSQLDLEGLREHCEGAAGAAASPAATSLDQHLEPVPPQVIGSVRKSDPSCLSAWEDEGECVGSNDVERTGLGKGRECWGGGLQ